MRGAAMTVTCWNCITHVFESITCTSTLALMKLFFGAPLFLLSFSSWPFDTHLMGVWRNESRLLFFLMWLPSLFCVGWIGV